MKTCEDVIALLSDYVEGDLSPGQIRDFEAHMALCVPCVDFLESLKRTRSLVRGLRCDEVPREVHEQLRTFLDRSKKGKRT
jgi:anti-sigma factor RsiW